MPKIIKHNYYALPSEAELKKNLKIDLNYCNDIEIKGRTWSVYYTKNPTKEQNYKHFLLLGVNLAGDIVSLKKNKTELECYRIVDAIHCLKCDTVVYSPHRLAMVPCECKSVSIDGGSQYSRISFDLGEYDMHKMVKLDIITGIIIPEELV